MPTCGVYRFYHIKTGKEYIGSSIEIEKRIDHHLFCLKNNRHTSGLLQGMWNHSEPSDWNWEILIECLPEERLNYEQSYIDNSEGLLNYLLVAGSTRGGKLSEATKAKLRESRKRYLETPGAREALAERARKQHAAGKLGQSTWVKGHPQSTPEGKAKRKEVEAKKREAGVKRKINWTQEERQKRSARMKQMHADRKLGTHTLKPETLQAKSELMKQLHSSGKIDVKNISQEERARRSEKMKELNRDGVLGAHTWQEGEREKRSVRMSEQYRDGVVGPESYKSTRIERSDV